MQPHPRFQLLDPLDVGVDWWPTAALPTVGVGILSRMLKMVYGLAGPPTLFAVAKGRNTGPRAQPWNIRCYRAIPYDSCCLVLPPRGSTLARNNDYETRCDSFASVWHVSSYFCITFPVFASFACYYALLASAEAKTTDAIANISRIDRRFRNR